MNFIKFDQRLSWSTNRKLYLFVFLNLMSFIFFSINYNQTLLRLRLRMIICFTSKVAYYRYFKFWFGKAVSFLNASSKKRVFLGWIRISRQTDELVHSNSYDSMDMDWVFFLNFENSKHTISYIKFRKEMQKIEFNF